MAVHRSVPRAARGEIWENISTPACQIPACRPRTQNRWTRFIFCKTKALNPANITTKHVLKLKVHVDFNYESSPSRAICSNCSGRAVHIPQNFHISRKLFKKWSTWKKKLNAAKFNATHLLLEIVCPTRRSVVVAILSQVFLCKAEVDALHRKSCQKKMCLQET